MRVFRRRELITKASPKHSNRLAAEDLEAVRVVVKGGDFQGLDEAPSRTLNIERSLAI